MLSSRPYIIVVDGIPRVTRQHVEELNLGVRTFDDFLKDG